MENSTETTKNTAFIIAVWRDGGRGGLGGAGLGGAGLGWAGLGRHSRFDEDKLCSGRIKGVWVNHLSRQTVIS